MQYTVGQFSKLLGVSSETLRHYERCGMLKAQRNDINKYRLFTDRDILTVLNIKKHRCMSIPIPEISEMLTGKSVEEQHQCIVERERELDRQMEQLKQMKARFNEYHTFYKRATGPPGQITEHELPNVYRLYCADTTKILEPHPPELMRRWIDCLFYTYIFITIPCGSITQPDSGPLPVQIGIGATEKNFLALGLPSDHRTERLEGGPGLTMTLRTDDIFAITPKDLEPLTAYVAEKGYNIDGGFFGSLDAVEALKDTTTYYISIRAKIKQP